jgi:NAD+ synthase (glutamine-hydrolysing)
MCGGYAPLKDVYKSQVYRLARWRKGAEKPGSECTFESLRRVDTVSSTKVNSDPSSFPIPIAVIERAPSAELRAEQTDQDSLPPYEVLDGILQRCIEGAQSQDEIIAAGFDANDVQRVVRMLYASEFKRRQAAPGPRVSPCAFGRERRYPISNAWR